MHELFHTTIDAIRSFLFLKDEKTSSFVHIRDALDIKRIMILVVFALLPTTIWGIINTGLHAFLFNSFHPEVVEEYIRSSHSLSGYLAFLFAHFLPIIKEGFITFLPLLIVSYGVGGFWEAIFAAKRGKRITEGFLVTGILFTLTLPPTLPIWMTIFGISTGIILGKELFGGTGMNIFNPALVCRCILYFTFPSYMTGEVWIAPTTHVVSENIEKSHDQITGASMLTIGGPSHEIKRIHIDTILLSWGIEVPSKQIIETHLSNYNADLSLSNLSPEDLKAFITEKTGLDLTPPLFIPAYNYAKLKAGKGVWTNGNFFFGNQIGSIGETSTFAILIGALLLLITRIASFRIMAAAFIGAYLTALLFQLGSYIGAEGGLWNPAHFDFPAYKHLLLGGLAFGIVFMATDPVSSPSMPKAKWAYGLLIGFMTLLIRVVNPAFPEGVMLAILFANAFAPLFDKIALKSFRKRRRIRVKG